MKTSKSDITKEKSKSKTPCSSKKASKFLEKEGFNNFSLNFKGLAVSLSDFTPNQGDETKGVSELDFDIGKQLKKIEKKDPGTKQKALLELIDLVNVKDNESVVGMLRFWPKIYNRLSVDDDKRVRELSQELMSNLARLCGKSLGMYIKQLLPTWIFSQSDVHAPVAMSATQSFNDTFPDEVRRQKAYILCWEEISAMISTSINRVPIKDKTQLAPKEKDIHICKDDTLSEMKEKEISIPKVKVGNDNHKKIKTPKVTKEKSTEVIKDSIHEIILPTLKEYPTSSSFDAYVDDIVLHLRTLVTLLPFISNNPTATADITKWIHSKQFWIHYSVVSHPNIISIYLTLSSDLLTHVPKLVLDSPFVIGHITQALRFVDNFHSALVPLVWTTIIKCSDTLGDNLWQHVSFSNSFLPKWLKMLECGVDGRISLASSFMLPFFTKIPLDKSLGESTITYERIFDAMIKGLSSTRVRHNAHEANSLVTTIFECATYTVLGARTSGNEKLKERVLAVLWRLLEKYLTDTEYVKADRTVAQFCQVSLRPLLNKSVLNGGDVTEILTAWIERYHDLVVFSKHLALLIIELARLKVTDDSFNVSMMDTVQLVLLNKVVNEKHCLQPYLSIISSHRVTNLSPDHLVQLRHVFTHCGEMIASHGPEVTNMVALALANILNTLPEEAQELYEVFLSTLSADQIGIFFAEFYGQFIGQIRDCIVNVVAASSLDVWQRVLSRDLAAYDTDDRLEVHHSLATMYRHCRLCPAHREHLSLIIGKLDTTLEQACISVTTADYAETLATVARNVIEECHAQARLDLVPSSLVLSLIRMILSEAPSESSVVDLSQVRLFLSGKTDYIVSLAIVDEVLQCDHRQTDVAVALLSLVLLENDHDHRLVTHLRQMISDDVILLDGTLARQRRYSLTIVSEQQQSLLQLIHKLTILVRLSLTEGCPLKETIDSGSVLVTPVMMATFGHCQYSGHVLQQCEAVFRHSHAVLATRGTSLLDHMLDASSGAMVDDVSLFRDTETLTLAALRHFIPGNYSQWSSALRLAVDDAIDQWTGDAMTDRQLSLIFDVLLPVAAKARYLVHEVVLATLASYLSDDVSPTIGHVNRALRLVRSLSLADAALFASCWPLVLTVRPLFESHIDQLYDASPQKTFDLSSLLETLTVGVESSSGLTGAQWDFVLCLVSTLSRSAQFLDSGDYARSPVTDDGHDHLINSVLLLRLVAAIAVALASETNDTVLDEWDNFHSEPLFRTILDLFSLLAGDHGHGRLVAADLFVFYQESLADAVSLCPVPVLLGHDVPGGGLVHVNDPVDLPRHLLVVVNSLLSSLSSQSLSTQLAAYSCLLNLTDHMAALLLDRTTALETSEESSLDDSSITLPHQWIVYLQSDHLTSLSITDGQTDTEIILTRCFLAWSVLLQLFSCSQAKVRAEISTFLVTHDRLFDKFLSFCFGFMPKSPLVAKKHLSFLADNHSCNLVADEPLVFSRCIEQRTKFVIYHLASFVFRRSVQVLPNLARRWFMALEVSSQQQVDTYVRQYITPQLFKIEFAQLKDAIGKEFDEKLEIQALPMIGQVTVRYIVPGDQCLEQVITMPSNYPIGKIAVDFKKEMSVKMPHWKSWIIQMSSTMQNQNGSIVDGVKLWKKNLDNHFDGMEECMICYSILHAIKYTLPSMKCRQCKKKFHKDCMYKWFQSSTNPTCPNCRNVFYDGTYKRAQYGYNDA